MKTFFLLAIVATTLFSCKTKDNGDKTKADSNIAEGYVAGDDKVGIIPAEDKMRQTQIQWLDTLKDLGSIKKAGLVDVAFRFKNIGTKPLSIINVSAGCGCTAPQKPAKLIPPGETSEVRAKFNTASQSIGQQQKSIMVTTNTEPSTTTLYFKALITE